MSTGSDSDDRVPGAELDPPNGSGWLRMRAYCAGSNEHLLRPSVVSSLFPRLPQHSRAPFRLGVVMLLVAVTACALLRVPAAMIALAALGFPLLFVSYLRETHAFHGSASRPLLAAMILGAGLGIGWVMFTGAAVAREYDMALGVDMPYHRIVRDGLGVPIGAMLLMLAPVVLIRLTRPRAREVLDGFAIGALGALAFTAAATLSRLAPQVDDGLVDHDRPLSGLLVQAGIQAVAVPLTAAAVGGLVGVALWFTPSAQARRHPSQLRAARALTALFVIGCYAVLGLIDVAPVPQMWVVAVHLIVMALALLALRVGLQLVSLNETRDLWWPTGTRTGYRRLLTTWGTGIALLTTVLVVVSALVSSPPARYVCPPDCGSPPKSEPVALNPRFTAPDGAFSVAYPSAGGAYSVATADDGVTADFLAGDGGTMQLMGRPAGGRTPKEITTALVADTYPDTDMDYEIPNAMVGYHPGYGMVLDSWPQNATGDYMRMRVVILAAVKDDLALIAVATGPYHEYGPDFGPGVPSGANLDLAQDMGKYVNSFRWRGDPAR